MRTLSVANHKGGVGKTATVRALGDVLAEMGYRVLMVDIDPQSSLTTSCRISDASPSLVDVMGGAHPGKLTISQATIQIKAKLDLVPSNLALAATELAIFQRHARELILKKALALVNDNYDICLIDCPPSLSQLVVNAMAASDSVLVPAQPMPIDVAGVRLFLQTLDMIREDLNPELTILGILLTFYDGRLKTHQSGLNAMLAAGWPVLPVRIGRSVRVGEAAALGESITTFEEDNPQASAYQELGKEVALWLKQRDARR